MSGLIAISPCLFWALKTILNGEGVKLSSPKMQSLPSPHREGVMLSSSHAQSTSFLRLNFSPKYNSILPHRGKDSSPFKMQNLHKSFPTNYFLYLYFTFLFFFFFFFFFFSFLVLFHYYLNFWFFFFFFFLFFSFFPKLGILLQSEKWFPSVWGE